MTRLIDAPVIPRRFDDTHALGWFLAAASEARRRLASPPDDQKDFDLKKLAEDVWGVDGCLPLHVDKTKRGFRVLGLILVNDPGLVLVQGGEMWDIPPGTVFHIDGRKPHGAIMKGDAPDEGAFLFMAWDVHRHEDADALIDSIPESMGAFAAGEERVDVSTAARPLDELE